MTVAHLSAIIAAIRSIGYQAEPFDALRSAAQRGSEQRQSLWRLFVAAFGMMQVMMYALPSYMAEGDMPADIDALLRWASLCLTLPVMGFSALPFFAGAWRDVRARTVGMDVPIAIGLIVTFAASVYATFTGKGQVYYDSIATCSCAGRSSLRSQGLRVREVGTGDPFAPAVATRLKSAETSEISERVAVAELQPGDRVMVGPGETVPGDGVVESGVSEVDEALLSGESRGVPKRTGDSLIGGSTNILSRLVMRIERVGAETVIAGIGRLLERAHADKPRIAQLADRIAGFTAVVSSLRLPLDWGGGSSILSNPVVGTVLHLSALPGDADGAGGRSGSLNRLVLAGSHGWS
jgi:Cu2+-exporting ATPase